jgi:hypothetical protein
VTERWPSQSCRRAAQPANQPLPGELTLNLPYTAQPVNRRPARYTRGLPPSAAPQPSELARDLAELSQRSASGAEAAGGRAASPEGTPRGAAPLQLQHWRLLEGGEALPVCRDSVRPARHGGQADRNPDGWLAFCVSSSARASSRGAPAHGAAASGRVPAPAGVAGVARPARRHSARLCWSNRRPVQGQHAVWVKLFRAVMWHPARDALAMPYSHPDPTQVEFLHTLALLDEPRPADGAAPAAEVPELRAARGLFRWEARRSPVKYPCCPVSWCTGAAEAWGGSLA